MTVNYILNETIIDNYSSSNLTKYTNVYIDMIRCEEEIRYINQGILKNTPLRNYLCALV